MSAENRLTTDQLAALGPGDAVTIECAGDFRRPRHVAGTVVRITGSHIIVSVRSAKGVIYQERFRRRDGIREGGGPVRTELVNPEPAETSPAGSRRRTAHIDMLYRDWARNRADVHKLRRLHAAISECLEEESASVTSA